MVGESLIKKLFDNSCSRLHELEAKAGMVDLRMAYSFSDTYRMIHYTQAEIAAEAVTLETKKEAIAFAEEKVQSGAQAISKKQSVFYLIFDKATYGDEKTAINALLKQSSASCTYTWNDEMRMLTVWMK